MGELTLSQLIGISGGAGGTVSLIIIWLVIKNMFDKSEAKFSKNQSDLKLKVEAKYANLELKVEEKYAKKETMSERFDRIESKVDLLQSSFDRLAGRINSR